MFSYIVAIVWRVVTVECEVSHREHEVYHRLSKIDSDTAAEESGKADEHCKQSEQEEVPEIALCHVPTLLERTCESVFRVFQDVTPTKRSRTPKNMPGMMQKHVPMKTMMVTAILARI